MDTPKLLHPPAPLTPQEKLAVLTQIARALNGRQVTWAVGASLLLYFKGLVADFRDIDIMVVEEDIPQVRQALAPLGTLQPTRPNAQYATKVFLTFLVQGVEVDVMAGFTILSGGTAQAFPLLRQALHDSTCLGGETIPLQSLAQWRTYYALMGRTEKVALIDGQAQLLP